MEQKNQFWLKKYSNKCVTKHSKLYYSDRKTRFAFINRVPNYTMNFELQI